MLKNHHVLESKVAEALVAQVGQAARERPGGLREAHRTAHGAKAQAEKVQAGAQAAKGAGLRVVHRTAQAEKAHGAKAQAEKVQAGAQAAKGAGLREAHRTAQAEKVHGAKGAGLREAHRTAHAAKDQAGTQAA